MSTEERRGSLAYEVHTRTKQLLICARGDPTTNPSASESIKWITFIHREMEAQDVPHATRSFEVRDGTRRKQIDAVVIDFQQLARFPLFFDIIAVKFHRPSDIIHLLDDLQDEPDIGPFSVLQPA